MKPELLFLTVLRMSIVSGYVIICMVVIRLLMRRLPKMFCSLLWGIVLIRLVCPVAFESPFSLVPGGRLDPVRLLEEEEAHLQGNLGGNQSQEGNAAGETAAQTEEALENIAGTGSVFPDASADMDAGAAGLPTGKRQTSGAERAEILQIPDAGEPTVSGANAAPDIPNALAGAGCVIWGSGIVLLLLYSLCSYIGLKRRLGTAIPDGEGCYISDGIRTPFVLGMFRTKIYLPADLSPEEKEHVLLHERMHIRRGDTVFKPVFYLALVIHWFNPLVWLSYRLMEKDMEMACDEAVMARLGENKGGDYCRSLLNLALRGQNRTIRPLAFGESNTKQRVKNILRYRRPSTWVKAAAVILGAAAAFFFLADPLSANRGGIPADLTQDGKEETILAEIPENTQENSMAALQVKNRRGDELWESQFPLSGQTGISYYLYQTDEEDLLLRYTARLQPGEGMMSYQLFSLDETGQQQVREENEINYMAEKDRYLFDAEAVRQFLQALNGYLEHSILLLETRNGQAFYSTVEQPIRQTEEFRWMDQRYESIFGKSGSLDERLDKLQAHLLKIANQEWALENGSGRSEAEDQEQLMARLNAVTAGQLELIQNRYDGSETGEIVILAELPEDQITLYGYNDAEYSGRGVLLRNGEGISRFDITYGTSPRALLPEIYWDSGKEQLQMKILGASGTGLNIWNLYLFERTRDGLLKETMFQPDDYMSQLEQKISYDYDPVGQSLTLYAQGREIRTIDTSWAEEPVMDIYWGTIVDFELGETIHMLFTPALQIGNWPAPQYAEEADLTAVVEYGQDFTITQIQ
ncbi:M56 family metallopeptidase [Lachnospiraceae bacterium ASD3451]|uniref:M56 family metallopeptidase n=1 Tax=Diplocloster agilis TaxID=2850323 RepID=UPI001D4408EC|nr:M56 family metallopeptidase [Diplocloster agilis]MBU9744719.1 M56 family metallopeptidase [Diplocloster agilis]